MKIPLQPMSRSKSAQAHPFPLQIALQTQEFLQATLFQVSFQDIAVGEFVRQPDGLSRVEQIMTENGLDGNAAQESWMLFEKYKVVLGETIFQLALIAFNSEWDWYIRRLTEFIRFAREQCNSKTLSNEYESRLRRAARLPLSDQIEIVELAGGFRLPLSDYDRHELVEMSLVRNIGLHNRWEVDADYLKKTNRSGFTEGDLRLIDGAELQTWHSLIRRLVHSSSLECAKQFCAAPQFGP